MINQTIGELTIGDDQPLRVIAELGICHRGDVELAKKMATACAAAGADFIKFEIYQLETALTAPYRNSAVFGFSDLAGNKHSMNMFEAYESGFLSFDMADELIAHIKKLNKPFFATTTSIEEADFMMSRGACAVKLSSGEVDHIPLIHHCATKNYSVFLDLAKCNLWEVQRAAEEYRGLGGKSLVVMHNPVGYPSPPEMIDLKRIAVLRESLSAAVGYTCHSPGRHVIAGAIGMGARVVEKPVCPDKSQPYIEYAFAENMEDYVSFVEEVHFVDRSLGDGHRIWKKEELTGNLINRHGVVFSKALKKGTRISDSDVRIARPGFGLRPEMAEAVPGHILMRDVVEGEVVRWTDLVDKA